MGDKIGTKAVFGYILLMITGFGAVAKAQEKAIGIEQIRAADYVGSDRYALIIGIDDYRDSGIPDLKTCQADAAAMYELLTDPAKGGIKESNAYLLLGKNATTRNIKKHLSKLRQIPSKSTVFVYFSGHGAKEGGQAYWVTYDSEIDFLAASGLSDLEIQQFFSQIPSDRVVVMLDCCYAAATVKGGKASVADFDDVLKRFTGKGRAYLMAAGSGEEAIEAKDLKQSVFTHYLVEGMAGQADDNKDGVVVLTELSTYVDSHVADEARVRGGIQRPVVRMDNVSEPSKFGLTIDAQRLQRNIFESEQVKQLRQQRLTKLREYYLDEKLSVDLYQLTRQLVEKPAETLDDIDKQKLREIIAVADGTLEPDKLQRMLDAIETPQQRAIRLEREAKEQSERIKHQRIKELLSIALANDSKTNGKKALDALEELLQLDPSYSQALSLQRKISAYYGPSPGEVITNSIGMKLVWIPAGNFMMGSDSGESNEKPIHSVRISKGFYMGQTEVTQAQYTAVMGTNPSNFKGDNLPVETVSWNDATEFCRKLSQKENGRTYMLPTEAQWEYACRAQSTTVFSFGNSESALGDYAWYSSNKTHPVGQKRPNGFGLYDMHGNVWEWCSDFYDSNYYGRNDNVDPENTNSDSNRVLRGGCWYDDALRCRSAYRSWSIPGDRYSDGGFRVVFSASSLDF